MVNQKASPLIPSIGSRFDRVVLATAVTLLFLAGLLIWRGDRVGVIATPSVAGNNQEAVPAQSPILITFGQPMKTTETPEISLEPPVSGLTSWQGATRLIFQPDQPLTAETEYTVHLSAGLESREGRQLLKPLNWQFKTRPLQILYLAWTDDSYNQLLTVSPEGGSPTALTFPPDDVLDYALSPDGTVIAYTTFRDDGGSDLYLIDSQGQNRQQLLDCADGACSNPTWEPGGRRLIYERRTFSSQGGAPGPPRLWWLDLSTNQTVAVFEDTQWLGSFARFSPDGQWISYISSGNQEIQVYHLTDGRSIRIPSSSGEPAAWNADSSTVLITEIDFSGEQYSIFIYQIDVNTAEVTQLSGDVNVTDGWPTWSPDGKWLAFNRKPPRAPTGKQLWIMAPDGSQLTQLTNEPGLHHGPPAWSPDGRFLVYQQFAQAVPDAQPEIWLLNVETLEKRMLAAPGIQPGWLP